MNPGKVELIVDGRYGKRVPYAFSLLLDSPTRVVRAEVKLDGPANLFLTIWMEESDLFMLQVSMINLADSDRPKVWWTTGSQNNIEICLRKLEVDPDGNIWSPQTGLGFFPDPHVQLKKLIQERQERSE